MDKPLLREVTFLILAATLLAACGGPVFTTASPAAGEMTGIPDCVLAPQECAFIAEAAAGQSSSTRIPATYSNSLIGNKCPSMRPQRWDRDKKSREC